MMTEEYMMKRLLAARLDKPPQPAPLPKPKPAQVKADERFDERNKPTVAIIDEATASNTALARRMEAERKELAKWIADGQDPRVRYQCKLDEWQQSIIDANERVRALHGEVPERGIYSPITRFEREMKEGW
jgi:hypothetical protein